MLQFRQRSTAKARKLKPHRQEKLQEVGFDFAGKVAFHFDPLFRDEFNSELDNLHGLSWKGNQGENEL